ncbi:MAG: hypothetical protein KAV82_01785 [Phycisphaerae bacterium]|nr:hypothetical protein [Phycisphaerae bacterium]
MLIVLVVLGGWFAHFAYLRITLRPTPRVEYWEAQIVALDPPPPGAISSQKANDILLDRPWESDPELTEALQNNGAEILRGVWDESRVDIIAATVLFETDEFKSARAELRQAAEAGWLDDSSFSLTRVSWGLHSDYHIWSRWLSAHSRWSIEHHGHVEVAVEDWLVALQMSRQLRRARLGDAQLISSIADRVVANEMICCARDLRLPIDTRALALKIDEILGPASSPRELLAGKRALAMCRLEQIYVRDGGDWLDVSEAASHMIWCQMPGGRKPSRIWNLTSPLFHDFAIARARVEEAVAVLDSANTFVAADQAGQTLSTMEPGPLAGFESSTFFSTTTISTTTVVWLYRVRTQLDAAVTMLALGEYHRRNHRYPDTLDELIPKFLPYLPIDYADRQPLRYRLTDDGFLLYSIDVNGIDDGGACRNSVKPWARVNLDAVFSAMHRHEVSK